MTRRGLLALVLALLIAAPARAQERVGVRVGDHPGHGRIVFDWPGTTAYAVEEQAGRIVLRFATAATFDLPSARRLPRNLQGIAAEGGVVTLSVAPGARLRHFRLGPRVVVDVLDPGAPTGTASPAAQPRQAPARREAGARPPASAPVPVVQAPAPPIAALPLAAPPAAAAPPAPVATPTAPAAPPAPRGVPVQPLADGFVVPAAADVGAALLRRGGTWLLVLDAPVPLDLAPLGQGAFACAEIARGPQATVLRIPAAVLAEPRLLRGAEGWRLENAAAAPVLRSIRAEPDPGPPARLLLRAARPANAVAVLDPETGGTLLVGTVREGGEATQAGRRSATFEILPTRLGLAILPRADSITLRALPTGFVASAGPGGVLALGPAAEEDAAEATGMSRLFDLPAEPLLALIQRERNATLAVAAAAPLGRGPPRLRNAEALLALGLAAEAQAMMALAMREDPRLAEDPVARALQAAAALVAGRVDEAEALLSPRLPESDELALWRGLLAAARDEDGAGAIAAGLPILRAWPEPLRARLAPRAAEALAAGGEAQAARRLLAGREDDPAFGLARARLLEESGDRAAALDAYSAVMRGRDRRARAVAMRRAVELRLAAGALDAAGAAAAMESVLAAWRGDALESAVRLRLAELRATAGDHRGAFEALREAAQLFPALTPALRPRQAEALLAALEREPPVAAVALFDAHAALLPAGPQAEQALAALADRLAALDLPVRAREVLAQALARSDHDESRARLGLRIAALALGAGDPAGARAALADTAAAALPVPLKQERALVEARALARMGAAEEAAAAYRAAGPDAAPEFAEFLAARQDWAGAAAVLGDHLVRAPAPPEPLDAEARRLVARRAALLALAGDDAGLAALREAEAARMAGGAFEEAFALLTARRMEGVGDLPRARQELELARVLPSRLEALRPAPGGAR